jgi:uncharacterized protein YndB with AHSA1/START domain
MEGFNWSEFTKQITVKADMQTVYDAWTKSGMIEQWFLSRCTYMDEEGNPIAPDTYVAEGGKYSWHWFAYEEGDQGSILAANGKDYFAFTFVGDCKTEVTLSETEGEILVSITQSEIPLDDESKKNIRLGCAFGWTFYLINLKSVLEGGIDLRNKNTNITAVVNN